MIHYNNTAGLTDLPNVVQAATRKLRSHAGVFDSIAVEGVSGLVVGAPVALALGKPLVIIRKSTDELCVHASEVENAQHAGHRYLFLDDYVGSGHTRDHVRDMMSRFTYAQYAGTYEYRTGDLYR